MCSVELNLTSDANPTPLQPSNSAIAIFWPLTKNFNNPKPVRHNISKQIHLIGERFILKFHQNTTNYSYSVNVSVSIRVRHQKKLVAASSDDEGL